MIPLLLVSRGRKCAGIKPIVRSHAGAAELPAANPVPLADLGVANGDGADQRDVRRRSPRMTPPRSARRCGPKAGDRRHRRAADGSGAIKHIELGRIRRRHQARRGAVSKSGCTDPAIEIDGDIAMVWSALYFYHRRQAQHCGTDHFDCVREDWRVEDPEHHLVAARPTRCGGADVHDPLPPHRQSRRDRLPDHPHRARAWASAPSRSIRTPTPRRCMSAQADEAVHIGPSPGARKLSGRREDHRRRQGRPAPRRSIPAMASCRENADFAQAVIDAGLIWVGPRPRQHPRDGPEGRRQEADDRGRRAGHAGLSGRGPVARAARRPRPTRSAIRC